jgi:hypothetical protein
MRWKGSATSHLVVPIRRPQPKIHTDEDTVDLSAASPCTTRMPRSPGSSTAKDAAPPGDCHTPPGESKAPGTTGASSATPRPTNHRKESWSP